MADSTRSDESPRPVRPRLPPRVRRAPHRNVMVAMRDGVRLATLRIFVMGGGSGWRSGAGRLMHGGRWRDEHEWPLPRTRFTDFYLHGDAALDTEPPRETSSATTYT